MAAPSNCPWLWHTSHPDLFADPAQAHVWQLPLDIGAERLDALAQSLSPDELARMGRFPAPLDQRRFIARRGSLRVILAGYQSAAPEALRFAPSPHGKPEIAGEPRLYFNLTHSEDLALLAVSAACPVGVDLERLRTDFDPEPLAERFFAPAEQEVFRQAAPAEKHRVYWAIWTAKEAALKALGTGLTLPLNSFAVLPEGTATLSPPLRLQSLFPAPDFLAALAIAEAPQGGRGGKPGV